MLSSYTPLIALILLIILMWLCSWWVVKIVSAMYQRSLVWMGWAKQREDVAGLWSWSRKRYPKTSRWLEVRLTTRYFSGLLLTLIVLAMLYLLSLFGGLVEELLEAEELIRIDHRLNQQLGLLRTDETLTVFAWITDLAGSPALLAVAFVSTGVLWAHRQISFITPLWLTFLGSQLMTYSGKFLLQRQRPESVTELVEITPSFPSGHATSALAVYGFMAYVISRELNTGRQRFELVFWTAALILLIGFSRMILSVHYASDVAAGFLVGSFWLLMGIAIAELIYRKN
ncbi:MAG: phosphatase PAP2 family protein [Methylophaga sp.]|nr:phosphatase PAP2 family protein [Methylophaga sp.]